ncbi:MAG TPA: CBS domain-containing protein, partial [Cystobacter sp.]
TRLRLPVRDFMSTRLQTVDVRTPVPELLTYLDKGYVPIVMMGDEFIGLITRIDLLNHLRRKLR